MDFSGLMPSVMSPTQKYELTHLAVVAFVLLATGVVHYLRPSAKVSPLVIANVLLLDYVVQKAERPNPPPCASQAELQKAGATESRAFAPLVMPPLSPLASTPYNFGIPKSVISTRHGADGRLLAPATNPAQSETQDQGRDNR